jgi:pimeloyl-ACP methyl ester carboxylesterase
MRKVVSRDGSRIACSTVGEGPDLVVVLGALNSRRSGATLAKLLAPRFTVTNYDRRGRGSSTDTAPYAPEREVEDLQAVLDGLGGSASVYGHSSGAAIALRAAAAADGRVRALAVYEPPYTTTDAGRQDARDYDRRLRALLAAGDHDAAVALFIAHVGVSEKQIAALKQLPMWKGLVALAPTLAYDSEILGDGQVVPVDLAKEVRVPTLVMHGGKGADSMRVAAAALAAAIPDARLLEVPGQDHGVSPKALAPVLDGFLVA